MGYRSRVECRIVGKKDDIYNVLAQMRLTFDRQDLLTEALDYCILTDYDDGEPGKALFGWSFEEVKWYDSYADIQTYNTLWGEFESYDTKFSGAFIRFGEDVDDTETKYFGADCAYDLLVVVRNYEGVSFGSVNLLSSSVESK